MSATTDSIKRNFASTTTTSSSSSSSTENNKKRRTEDNSKIHAAATTALQQSRKPNAFLALCSSSSSSSSSHDHDAMTKTLDAGKKTDEILSAKIHSIQNDLGKRKECDVLKNALSVAKVNTGIQVRSIKEKKPLAQLMLSAHLYYGKFCRYLQLKDIGRLNRVCNGLKSLYRLDGIETIKGIVSERCKVLFKVCCDFNSSRDVEIDEKYKSELNQTVDAVKASTSLHELHSRVAYYSEQVAKLLTKKDAASTDYVQVYGTASLPLPLMAHTARNFHFEDIPEPVLQQNNLSEEAFFAIKFILKRGQFSKDKSCNEFHFNNVKIATKEFSDEHLPDFISALKNCKGLKKLFLHNNSLTDASVPLLEEFCQSMGITEITVYGNRITKTISLIKK